MANGLNRMGQASYEMFADWTDRIMGGELPPAPPRPEGVERNVVVTQWDWADPKAYLHDEISTDKRDPTVNPYGPIYGALEASADYTPVLDPGDHAVRQIPVPVRDPNTPVASGEPRMPSPYWGDEAIWDSRANVHNPMLDHLGRLWLTSRVRAPDNPAFCREGSDHPSALLFPTTRTGRNLAMYDPATQEFTLVDTCYSTHHLIFAEDDDHTLWTSGGGQVIGWLNTRMLEETGDEAASQGWSPLILDTNGNGRRDEWVEPGDTLDATKDTRITSGYYGVAYNPNDGSIWGTSLGFPGGFVRFDPATGLTEFYETPWNAPDVAHNGYSPRGGDIDRDGVMWGALASGHMASFDRNSCTGPLNGPTATGAHCPEGWTLYPEPLPQLKGVTDSGSAEGSYYTWVDQFQHARARRRRSDQHRQRFGGAARAGGRGVGRVTRTVPARLLHEVDGRPHRRPRRRLEGSRNLGNVRHPCAIPPGDRQGDAEQGAALPAEARSAGEVSEARYTGAAVNLRSGAPSGPVTVLPPPRARVAAVILGGYGSGGGPKSGGGRR